MIYLASTSPRRKRLLREAGIPFKAINPSYRERHELGISPAVLVKKHAFAKARSCISKVSYGVILGSDTIVYCCGRIIGKPKNLKEAFNILNRLQGRWHVVYTGVAVLTVEKRRVLKKRIFSVKTDVRIKTMDREAIVKYFKKINPLDKAGAYAIQSKKAGIVAEVKGSLSNAIGLPIERMIAWTGSASKDPLSPLGFRGKWQGRRRRERPWLAR